MPDWLTLPRSLEFFSLIGMLIAIVPAWVFNKRMNLAHTVAAKAAEPLAPVTVEENPGEEIAPAEAAERKRRAEAAAAAAAIVKWRTEVAQAIREQADAWKPWHGWCLVGAFVLSIVPQFWKIFL